MKKRWRAEIQPGDIYGKLKVLEEVEKGKSGRRFTCECECGNKVTLYSSAFLNGNTKSCGCLRRKLTIEKSTSHGLSKTPLHRVWNSMKQRCNNPNDKAYKNYGARGIKVCEEWKKDFLTFHKWAIESGYQQGLTLERIEVNGNYCPENCKWIPQSEQSPNRRSNNYLTFNGETKTLSQWSRDLSINRGTLRDRLKNGWTVEDALTIRPDIKNRRRNQNE